MWPHSRRPMQTLMRRWNATLGQAWTCPGTCLAANTHRKGHIFLVQTSFQFPDMIRQIFNNYWTLESPREIQHLRYQVLSVLQNLCICMIRIKSPNEQPHYFCPMPKRLGENVRQARQPLCGNDAAQSCQTHSSEPDLPLIHNSNPDAVWTRASPIHAMFELKRTNL